MEAEDNSDEQEPRPPPSLPDSFPTSDDEINDSLWSLLTDTNFDISTIGEEQEPEPEPLTHPSSEESDVEEDLPEPVFDVKFDESQMYEMVAREPTRSLLEIYEVVRQKYTAQLNPNSKLLFLQEFPSFLDLKTALLAQRRIFIPPDPKIIIEKRLFETFLTLGEVSLENENYPQAVEDLTLCLNKQQVLQLSGLTDF